MSRTSDVSVDSMATCSKGPSAQDSDDRIEEHLGAGRVGSTRPGSSRAWQAPALFNVAGRVLGDFHQPRLCYPSGHRTLKGEDQALDRPRSGTYRLLPNAAPREQQRQAAQLARKQQVGDSEGTLGDPASRVTERDADAWQLVVTRCGWGLVAGPPSDLWWCRGHGKWAERRFRALEG